MEKKMSSRLLITLFLTLTLLLASCQSAAPTATETSAPTNTPVPSVTAPWIWVEPTQPPTVTPLPAVEIQPAEGDSLRSLADGRGFLIGAAVNNGLVNEADYAEVLVREFNLATTENAMKFGIIHPEPGVYDFRGADEIVNFAHAHGMSVRGHTLVWQNQMPDWLRYGDWTSEQVHEILYQ